MMNTGAGGPVRCPMCAHTYTPDPQLEDGHVCEPDDFELMVFEEDLVEQDQGGIGV